MFFREILFNFVVLNNYKPSKIKNYETYKIKTVTLVYAVILILLW